MSADAVIGWVLTVASGLRLNQANTLADLVEATVHVGRGTLSAIGRCLPGPTAAEHRIKRAWRFCDNDRVHVSEVMPGVIRRLARKRTKPLLVALDWTDVRGFHTLMAAAVQKVRPGEQVKVPDYLKLVAGEVRERQARTDLTELIEACTSSGSGPGRGRCTSARRRR
jgi:hypothetical protein